jgi:energy-coupling factor transporter ATP-binding protein EcfA2
MSHQPKLLILDEATSGLDPMVRDEILTLFNDFTRDEEHSILLSSHIVSDLKRFCDYIAFLHKGKWCCVKKRPLLEEYSIVRRRNPRWINCAGGDDHSKASPYGTEALVRKHCCRAACRRSFTTLENIILFLAKEVSAHERPAPQRLFHIAQATTVLLDFLLIFTIIPNMNLSSIAIVYAAMLPITVIAYDERSKWDQLAAMMPYSKRELVFSKYLLGYIGVALFSIITLVLQVAVGLIGKNGFSTEQGMTIFVTAAAALVL